MTYDFMRELRAQWTRWVEEENKCPHCGGVLPRIQSPLANNLSAQQNVQRKHEHNHVFIGGVCRHCGKKCY